MHYDIKIILCFRCNGQPIKWSTLSQEVIQPCHQKVVIEDFDPQLKDLETSLIVSDASDAQSFVYEADSFRLIREYPFSMDETRQSSTLRELLSIHRVFSLEQDYIASKRGTILLWLTDSQPLVSIIRRGSRIPKLQQLVIDIKVLEFNAGIHLKPVWNRRSTPLLTIADDGTKPISSDEWSFEDSDYNKLLKEFQVKPTIDCMATAKNSRCSHFYSRVPEETSHGVDFFYQDITGLTIYICPPVNLIPRVIDKLISSRGTTAVLVVPQWPSSGWYGMIRYFKGYKPFVKKVHQFYTHFYSSSDTCMFKGKLNFQLIALLIQTA